jgi:hypothetical protein
MYHIFLEQAVSPEHFDTILAFFAVDIVQKLCGNSPGLH